MLEMGADLLQSAGPRFFGGAAIRVGIYLQLREPFVLACAGGVDITAADRFGSGLHLSARPLFERGLKRLRKKSFEIRKSLFVPRLTRRCESKRQTRKYMASPTCQGGDQNSYGI